MWGKIVSSAWGGLKSVVEGSLLAELFGEVFGHGPAGCFEECGGDDGADAGNEFEEFFAD